MKENIKRCTAPEACVNNLLSFDQNDDTPKKSNPVWPLVSVVPSTVFIYFL